MNKKICPKCESKNVKLEITASLALGAPQNWVCLDCGFSAPNFPELVEDEE